MKPRRPERSAVWQRTRLRPVAEPEESAPAVARSAATPLRPNLLMALYSTEARAVSSAGRAPALHAGGRRFDPVTAHTPPLGTGSATCHHRRMATIAASASDRGQVGNTRSIPLSIL